MAQDLYKSDWKQGLAVLLVVVFVRPTSVTAQELATTREPVSVSQSTQGLSNSLRVLVIRGDDALHRLGEAAVQPLIEVRDAYARPVAGAEVVFKLPEQGPGGSFPEGAMQGATTQRDGRATTSGLAPNSTPGSFNIEVAARHGGQVGFAFIHQTNETGRRAASGTLNVISLIPKPGIRAVNDIQSGTAGQLTVEIRDEQLEPVERAEVVFLLPGEGPGGSFPEGQTQKVLTNFKGQASTTGLAPNSFPGPFEVEVTATNKDHFGRALIPMENSQERFSTFDGYEGQPPGSGKWKLWVAIGAAAAAGTVLGILAGSSSKPITFSPGPVTIGAPQ